MDFFDPPPPGGGAEKGRFWGILKDPEDFNNSMKSGEVTRRMSRHGTSFLKRQKTKESLKIYKLLYVSGKPDSSGVPVEKN